MSGANERLQDEQLRRVLGLTTWDAAAELRAKAATKLRTKVLESQAHQKVVKAHDEYLVKPVADLKVSARRQSQMLTKALRDAQWVTPLTLERPIEELPTLEELFTCAWPVGTDGIVSQYIRAHRVAAGPVLRLKLKETRPRGSKSILLHLTDGDGSNVPDYTKRYEDCEDPFCRYCPEFSALYGHRVYICKQPAEAVV